MSYLFHSVPFKEGLHGSHAGYVQLGFMVLSSLVLLFLFIPRLAAAQQACGDIITEYDGQDERTPIVNCSDPFGENESSIVTEFLYSINGVVLAEGEVREVETVPVSAHLESELINEPTTNSFVLYRHEGQDYRQVDVTYLTGPGPVDLTVNATGTYSIVTSLLPIIIQARQTPSWRSRLLEFFIPTAHAQFGFDLVRAVLTFTITTPTPEPEPTGASSVLFLPGIQASRLYTDGVLGTEDQLWEPNRNQDVSQLAMTEDGQSIEDIYTREVIGRALGFIGIYASFIDFMDELVAEETIHEWEPFAYDWRYSAKNIVTDGAQYKGEVKYLADEVERLAGDSFSKKVTLVAHSNGGLLAKSLLTEFPELAAQIDKVVFIGTPHTGTPKALAVVLHGYDQQKFGGAIIDDSTAREVIKNMPGAYGLLPSRKYLSEAEGPTIFFRDSIATEAMRLQYGTSVNTDDEYIDFLNGVEGRVNQLDDISAPYISNPVLLDTALSDHITLDDWVAPSGIEVFNLVGVGLKTITALEYRGVEETRCTDTIFGGLNCQTDRFVRPYAHFTPYGDETVTAISAEKVAGSRYYFDLESFNKSLLNPLSSFTHADFLEVGGIQDFIKSIINGTSSEIEYVTTDRPVLTEEYEIVSVDSPVQILAADASGRTTGVIEGSGELKVVEAIPNSQYFEFGGTKYLITPKSTNLTFKLSGQAYGGFTLTVASLKGNQEEILSELINASTTPNMVATFSREQNTYSTLSTDTDGDGQVDLEMTLSGEIITTEDPVSFAVLRSEIEALGLAKNKQKALLVLVDVSEGFVQKSSVRPIFVKLAKETLLNLSRVVDLYIKKKWITDIEGNDLQEIINKLRDSII